MNSIDVCNKRLATTDDATELVAMITETSQAAKGRLEIQKGIENALLDTTKGLYYAVVKAEKIVAAVYITMEWSDWRNGPMWWVQQTLFTANAQSEAQFNDVFVFLQSEAEAHGVKCLRFHESPDTNVIMPTCKQHGMLSHYDVFEEVFHTSNKMNPVIKE